MKPTAHLIATFLFSFVSSQLFAQSFQKNDYQKVATYLEISATLVNDHRTWKDSTSREFLRHEEVITYYQNAHFQPVWVNAQGALKPSAQELLAYISKLLYPEYFEHQKLTKLFDSYQYALSNNGNTALYLSRLEMALTHAFFEVGDVNLKGYVTLEEDGEGMSWYLSSRLRNIPRLLEIVALYDNPAEMLDTVLPQDAHYKGLKSFLAKYIAIAQNGGWPVLPEELTEVEPGDTSEVVNILRERLVITEDLAKQYLSGDIYDEHVEEAVMFYQGRNGLKMDGVVGKNTFDNLNIAVDERIRQLQVNIERAKWLPDARGERYIWVNIPEYKLRLYKSGKVVQEHIVVAGAKRTQTPCFDSHITDIVINPYWNVPYSIAKNEIGPKVHRDAQYLLDKNYEVINGWGSNKAISDSTEIDWADKSSYNKVRFRQKPGPGNALGQLKFNLPSRWSIYLHDTPSKSAFKRTHRALSHGCIRVHNPKALAATLLQSNPNWDEETLYSTINQRKTRTAMLQDDVNVFIVYMTSWVDDSGQLQLREDVYGRDNKFDQKLRQI